MATWVLQAFVPFLHIHSRDMHVQWRLDGFGYERLCPHDNAFRSSVECSTIHMQKLYEFDLTSAENFRNQFFSLFFGSVLLCASHESQREKKCMPWEE